MARKFAAVVFSLGCLHVSSVMALGLGELSLESFLNEPLKAHVDLLNTGNLHEDEIRIRLATKEDFEKLGLDRAYFLTSIKFEVSRDERGRAKIIITSDDPVLEPYLDFIVEARWPSGRLLREYTVLVDPPVFDQSTPVVSASKRVAEVYGEPEPVKKTTQTAPETSGTHVDIKKSGLAPGEMPQRGYNAEASTTPLAGSRYMIRRDDTLWEVAMQARPEGASVHQTMLDIQRLNPSAFIDGNINRVKAGYIVYLPDAAEISSADVSAALAEVRQQNEDWRAGRESQPSATAGPALRISAEPQESPETIAATPGDQPVAIAGGAAAEDMDKVALESAEMEQRLVAMEQQVETLQRIVSLKDDQIAALQGALANGAAPSEAEEDALAEDAPPAEGLLEGDGQELEATPEEMAESDSAATPVEDSAAATEDESTAAVEPAVAVAPVTEPRPAPAPAPAPEPRGGIMDYLMYIVGALLLAILGFIFLRRRGSTEEGSATAPAAADVFADVELTQPLEVEAPAEPAEPDAPVVAALSEEEPPADDGRDNRGYGERKHDEYASDEDAGDALAEADIYIAYGRFTQAIDLLNGAVANDPNNAAYRVKLLEAHAELGDQAAVEEQLAQLQAIGDADSLARAEQVMAGLGGAAAMAAAEAPAPDLDGADPLDLAGVLDDSLEADFSGLEIESPDATASDDGVADDLDLSADFIAGDTQLSTGDDEDLVIAAESNGLSTKLDLARAYLDMGDEDGARQILEEVAAEGSDELQAEARALLDRIG
jgi:pilus assembly protein FimV